MYLFVNFTNYRWQCINKLQNYEKLLTKYTFTQTRTHVHMYTQTHPYIHTEYSTEFCLITIIINNIHYTQFIYLSYVPILPIHLTVSLGSFCPVP